MKTRTFLIYSIGALIIQFLAGCGGGYSETEVVSSNEPATLETFQESLSGDGEWIKITKEEIDPEGIVGTETVYDDNINVEYIWRPNPTYVYVGWNPYINGRWVWTDWGWMWASNYNWGWATYHYGRWWWSGLYGWVWSPGYRWAPAWVTWRFSDDHIGWYPLSPRIHFEAGIGISNVNYNFRNENWTFIQKNNFTNVVNNTTIVNINKNEELINNSKQYVNIKEQNNKIVNSGPQVSEIEKATGKSIQQKSIQETSIKGKPTVNKNTVSVYRGTNKSIAKNKGKNQKGNYQGNNQKGEKENFKEEKKKPE